MATSGYVLNADTTKMIIRTGSVNLSGGTATVTDTAVGASTKIFLSAEGTTNAGILGYAISNGASFTISSLSVLDARTVDYIIIN